MSEQPGDLEWRLQDAEHNYEMCNELLTVPEKMLNLEIETLLAASAS
jgi:hypothetical protein